MCKLLIIGLIVFGLLARTMCSMCPQKRSLWHLQHHSHVRIQVAGLVRGEAEELVVEQLDALHVGDVLHAGLVVLPALRVGTVRVLEGR